MDKAEKWWCVYIHTSPSNKRYVGITSLNPYKRWNGGVGYKRHPYFWSAIQRYGWENFNHEVIFSNLSKEEAERLEQICILLFKSNNRAYGYNCSIGGENGATGSKRTSEQLRAMSERNKGKKLTEEHKRKLSLAHKGKMLNLSDRRIEQLSQMFTNGNNPNARKVYCFETNTLYDSGASAAKELKLNVGNANVCRCCRGETKSCGGYHFCFEEDIPTVDIKEKTTNNKKVKVFCIETGSVYESVAEASRKVLNGKSASGIVRNCQGKQETCCGYHFAYVKGE